MNTGTQPVGDPKHAAVRNGSGSAGSIVSMVLMATGTAERAVLTLAMAAIVCLPLIEVLGRLFAGHGIPGSIHFVRHLTLWIGFLGAMLAVPRGRHLALGIASNLPASWRAPAEIFAGSLAVAVSLVLAKASYDMVMADRASLAVVGGIFPLWAAEIIMPVGFTLIGARFLLGLPGGRRGRAAGVAMALLVACLAFLAPEYRSFVLAPGLILIGVAAAAGAPIFVALGAVSAVLFYADATPLASISVEAYRIASNPILPTIPLFTLAGTILAAGNSSDRLVRAFRALFGWFPGGTAVVTIAVCAFFTTFSGGSGVTVLALGGLMLPVLVREGYGDKFSLGTITASGSLGILFPPSLLIILYGVASLIPIDRLFAAAFVPGLLLMGLVCLYAAFHGRSVRHPPGRFDPGEAVSALADAKWEMMLPLVVLFAIFSGLATLVEAASLTVLYAAFVGVIIHREINPRRDLPRLLVSAACWSVAS